MPQSDTANRKFVLAERPKGEPTENTLRLETDDLPKVGAGQMLLRNEYLSLDPLYAWTDERCAVLRGPG